MLILGQYAALPNTRNEYWWKCELTVSRTNTTTYIGTSRPPSLPFQQSAGIICSTISLQAHGGFWSTTLRDGLPFGHSTNRGNSVSCFPLLSSMLYGKYSWHTKGSHLDGAPVRYIGSPSRDPKMPPRVCQRCRDDLGDRWRICQVCPGCPDHS